jgi:hypothetical protein
MKQRGFTTILTAAISGVSDKAVNVRIVMRVKCKSVEE